MEEKFYPRAWCISVFILSLVFSFSQLSEAQNVMGARSIGLGGASAALPTQEWAVFSNPAMLPSERPAVSFFGIRYYGFSEITDIAAAATYPTKYGVFGAGAHRYGFDLFSENRVKMAYKNGFQNFHYGLAVTYHHISQGGGYGSAGALGLDLGVGAKLLERAWIAARATNLNRPTYTKVDEPLPRELALGFSYAISDIALVISELVKDVRFPISYRGGIEVHILQNFTGRAGVSTQPTTFAGGFGYAGDLWSINIVAQNHLDLGISPGLDLSVRF